MKKKVFSVLMAFSVIVMFAGFTHPQEIKNSRVRQWKGGVGLNASVTNKFAASMDNPLLEWNTFLGGELTTEDGSGIAIDRSGNIYVIGTSSDPWGSPLNPFTGIVDAFVAKLSPDGVLQWHTFLGGSIYTFGNSIVIDNGGNIYVTGESSTTWGSPVNPFDDGAYNYFVARLNSNGVLQWNTFLAGNNDQLRSDIVVDQSGDIYVTGCNEKTWGSPVNPFAGQRDAFVARLKSNGVLMWNTFLGGIYFDYGRGIATDNSGNIYVTGSSSSTWGSPVNPFIGERCNAFVARLNSDGVLQWSTFFGGGKGDYGRAIAADANGNIFVSGASEMIEDSMGMGLDVFVARLNSNGIWQWNTYLGGGNYDWGYDLALDGRGNIYVCGDSNSTWGSPVNPFVGESNAFVAMLDANGACQWNTFLGGDIESGSSIAIDESRNIYVTGYSFSTWGSPVNPHSGWNDAFVAKIVDTDVPPYEITLNRDKLYFGSTGNVSIHSQTFIVSSNISTPNVPIWSITSDQTWLYFTPTEGTGPGLITVSVNPDSLSAGTYTGTITVSDPIAVNSPQTISVTLDIYSPGQTTGPFGEYSTPTDGSLVSGSVPFTGWALDDIGVESVKIYLLDGSTSTYIGDAAFIEGAWPDVELAYPGFPMNYRAGWCYLMLTNSLLGSGNGTFTIAAIAIDREGNQVSLGAKTITVDNAHAVKPFGAIDTPGQNGTVSGRSYRNNGWVLTPPPNLLPTDGTTINVWVDGVRLGHPLYNLYRPDVSSLFPGYANSNGAGGYFDFDTTAYENGMHSIFWTATDNAGNTDGIGSRYFYILNTGSSYISAISTPKFKDILAVPLSHDDPVKLKKGFNDSCLAEEVLPDADGMVSIRCHELERIELQVSQAGNNVEGYLVVGQRLKRLPIGSTLDSGTGTFNWIPGPGFIGMYRLVFVETDKKGEQSREKISVTIIPKFSRVIN
ncbi:MAG: SBBP repeat-containing protein [Candidatus Aminicenantes bacterium]|nr:SBBP repeat-containing protein [Candidatus Aminicenantes bacterium]